MNGARNKLFDFYLRVYRLNQTNFRLEEFEIPVQLDSHNLNSACFLLYGGTRQVRFHCGNDAY